MALPPGAGAAAPDPDAVRLGLGFVDMTFDLNQEDYREPAAAEYRGTLYVAWVSKEPNPDLPHGNGTQVLSSRVLFVRGFNDTNGRPERAAPVLLTPGSSDTLGHGNHAPTLVTYQDRLYMFWQSNDAAQKPDGSGFDTDILLRTFDGTAWSPPTMASEEGPRGAADFSVTAAVHQGRLVLAWSRNVLATAGNGSSFGEIVTRTFDGNAWAPATVISPPTARDVNDYPSLAVLGDRLHAVWARRTLEDGRAEVLWAWTEGRGWSTPVAVQSQSETGRAYSPTPRLAVYNDPVTGTRDLYLVSTVLGDGAVRSAPDDLDIVVRRLQGGLGTWGAPVELTARTDRGLDENPSLGVGGDGRLYAAWETLDDTTADGQDRDLVARAYDGRQWGPATPVSRVGDRDAVGWQERNLGDDEQLRLVVYRNKIAALFRTWDDVTGRDGRRDVILRYLSEYDNDGDGYLDREDGCPADPGEHADSDRDGVCDGDDPRPLDPTIFHWTQIETPEEAQGITPQTVGLGLIAIGLLVAGVLAIMLSGRSRPPGRRSRPGGGANQKG